MNSLKTALMAGLISVVATAGAAHAGYLTGSFSFTVYTGATAQPFPALPNVSPFSAPVAAAKFTYTGPLNFNNPAQATTNGGDLNSTFFASAGAPGPNYGISNFTTLQGTSPVTGFPPYANYDNLADFLASSGSGANFTYGSYYTIDLGVQTAGTVLSITHDDGTSVFQNGVQVGSTLSTPTTAITDTVQLTSTADTVLYYARENSTPSVLEVAVPEPASFGILGLGLAGLAMTRFRRARPACSSPA